MKIKTAILWFRNDLRLVDHEPLYRAVQSAEHIIPVFCWDPRNWEQDSYGQIRTGPFRTRFLLQSLKKLDAELRGKGSKLHILEGKPEEVLPCFAQEQGAAAIFGHKMVGTEEGERESALEQQLFQNSIALELFWGATLLHLEDLPMPVRYLPEVFTQFRKEVESGTAVRTLISPPATIPGSLDAKDISWEKFERYVNQDLSKPIEGAIAFEGGTPAALGRMNAYLWKKDLLKNYKETRNGLLGGDYSSKFSPWLAMGCISPRQIYWEVKSYEEKRVKNQSTYWLIFELLWRDYFYFITHKHGKNLFRKGGIVNRELPMEVDFQKFNIWKKGETGFPFVDANMRELRDTGFMSNRGRQNVASFLVKDLGLDWRMGATYFEHILIDYDVCSNWGNWNYVAGVGNDPRKHRYFNIRSQGHRYDPKGAYIKHWLPELKGLPHNLVHEPWEDVLATQKMGVKLGTDYPFPIVGQKLA